jgi:hypothetical protein
MQQAEERLIDELVKDGIVKDRQYLHVVLTSSELVVNAQKQPEATFQKYRKMYEDGTGRAIGEGTVVLSNSGGNYNRTYTTRSGTGQFVPAPPAAPAAPMPPRAPKAPKAMVAPAAPSAPAPPAKMSTEEIRAELVRDGILKPDAKSYTLSWTDGSFVVNGQAQPTALQAKYRPLLGLPDKPGQVLNVTVNND